MRDVKGKPGQTPRPLPVRFTRWKAPTGRWLDPGKTFNVKGTRGKHVFIAFVDDGHGGYVECRKVGASNIRCISPDKVTTVHNASPEEFED